MSVVSRVIPVIVLELPITITSLTHSEVVNVSTAEVYCDIGALVDTSIYWRLEFQIRDDLEQIYHIAQIDHLSYPNTSEGPFSTMGPALVPGTYRWVIFAFSGPYLDENIGINTPLVSDWFIIT